jgi:CheY-like chemotaxis protein
MRRVLVIEDEPSAREALVSLLGEEGFIVRSASTGREGIDSYGTFRPDVVLCDYYLPDVDGLQVLRSVRTMGGDDTRFIMVTAGLSNAGDERALRAEADAFLGKPIDLDQLHLALQARGPSPDGTGFVKATS